MTQPNRRFVSQVLGIVRRTVQRQFLLRPNRDGQLQQDIGYVVALHALHHKMDIHAWCTMSNHYHGQLTLRSVDLGGFLRDAHHFIGKVVNLDRGRRESLWPRERTGEQLMLDTESVIENLLYTWLNPVRAGLVEHVEEWDGFMILPRHWGKCLRFKRPQFFTNEESETKPEFVEYTPMPPDCFAHLPLEETIEMFEQWIADAELAIASQRKGKAVIGMDRCYRIDPFTTPDTAAERYGLNPRFKGRDPKALSLAISWMKNYWVKYRSALLAFIRGKPIKFPSGTVQMSKLFGVPCDVIWFGDPHIPIYDPYVP